MNFKDIEFGKIAAEDELTFSPQLLIDGFFDEYGYIDAINHSEKFLIIGPKGSGKSAIGSRLDLTQKDRNSFVKLHPLENFPYDLFSGVLPGREAPEIRYPENWEFILMVASLNSFVKDTSFKFPSNRKAVFKSLIDLGLLSDNSKISLDKIVKKTTDKQFKLTLNGLGVAASSSNEKISDTKKLYASLQECFYSITLKSKHLLIIDGLDNVLTTRINQFKSLSALIVAADKINKMFYRNHIDAKIIVMCRTDLFDRLSEPNMNKIKQNSGIILDWFQRTKDLKSTNLAKLLNLRAKASLGEEIDVFETFFPLNMTIGKGPRSTIQILFDHTRHLPRDIIMLFNQIQMSTRDYKGVSAPEIISALDTYSKNYFISEIKDQLCGFQIDNDIEKIFQLLAKLGYYRFDMSLLEETIKCDTRFNSIDLSNMLNSLFDCNAIGNFDRNSGHITFKYRNQYSQFNPNQLILVHYGLQRALNLNRAQEQLQNNSSNFFNEYA